MTFLGLAHMFDATHTGRFSRCGVGWGGVGMMTYLALAHMFDATHTGRFSRGGVGWGGDDDVPRTCTHGRCYASHVYTIFIHNYHKNHLVEKWKILKCKLRSHLYGVDMCRYDLYQYLGYLFSTSCCFSQ